MLRKEEEVIRVPLLRIKCFLSLWRQTVGNVCIDVSG